MARTDFEAKALTGQIVVTVDGVTVALTDEQKREMATKFEAVKDALPEEDKAQVDFMRALNVDQRLIAVEVGVSTAEGWVPTELITRWKSAGASPLPQSRAAAELEMSLVALAFMAERG